MWKIVESKFVSNQWYIYRRRWWGWQFLDVRSGWLNATDFISDWERQDAMR